MQVYDAFEQLESYDNLAVPLARYAKFVGYDECAFWGVAYEGQNAHACSDLWTEYERTAVARALAEAQQMFEKELNYPLTPRFIVGTLAEEPNRDWRWVDQQGYTGVQATRYPRLLGFGVRTETVLAEAAQVDHAADPAVIGPVATTAIDPGELHVYYPGTPREITPSKVLLAGGMATIEIPRCRLVAIDRINNPASGLDYTDLDNFQAEVTVKYIYPDATKGATLLRYGCSPCTEESFNALAIVDNAALGCVRVQPIVCTDGRATLTDWCREYERVNLYYCAGLRRIPEAIETALVRLAHTRLPTPPCQCAKVNSIWEEDRNQPKFVFQTRWECPFGFFDGAYQAWKVAQSWRALRLGVV